MVQPSQGIWLRQSDRRPGQRHLRPYGNGALGGDRRFAAGRPARGPSRRGQEGPDRRRASPRLTWRAAAIALLIPFAACQPSASPAVTLERSPAGLEQVPLTITTAKGRKHRFTVE